MKRILLIFVLVLSGVWGEDSKDSQWRGFFGIEAGVGIFGVGEAIIDIKSNIPYFFPKQNTLVS